MSLLPVAVTKISNSPTTSSILTTGTLFMYACNAQIGSISVIETNAPADFKDSTVPFPTSPYPKTKAFLPAIITSVDLKIASVQECLHPYILSNLVLVTESFTLIAGNNKLFVLANCNNL